MTGRPSRTVHLLSHCSFSRSMNHQVPSPPFVFPVSTKLAEPLRPTPAGRATTDWPPRPATRTAPSVPRSHCDRACTAPATSREDHAQPLGHQPRPRAPLHAKNRRRDPSCQVRPEPTPRTPSRHRAAKEPTARRRRPDPEPRTQPDDRRFRDRCSSAFMEFNGASKQSLLPPPLLPLPIDDRLEVDRRPISSPWHPLIFPLSLYKLVTDLSPSHNRAPFLPQVLPRSSHSHPALWTTPDCLAGISPVSTPPRRS
jgi:hypothetical protein